MATNWWWWNRIMARICIHLSIMFASLPHEEFACLNGVHFFFNFVAQSSCCCYLLLTLLLLRERELHIENTKQSRERKTQRKSQSETHKMHVSVMRIISSCRFMVPRFSLLSYIKEEKALEINTTMNSSNEWHQKKHIQRQRTTATNPPETAWAERRRRKIKFSLKKISMLFLSRNNHAMHCRVDLSVFDHR